VLTAPAAVFPKEKPETLHRMSASGQKQTYAVQQVMSALPPIATAKGRVCFTPESGHVRCNSPCPLWANSGHWSRRVVLSGALDAQINLAPKRPEIDRFGEQRLGAILQSLPLGIRIAIGGDHDDGHIRSKSLGLG